MADSSKEKEEQARKAHALALAGNVLAAKMWMQSTVRLAPDLPGTPQIVAAYDVHAAAARSSPTDWYAVLGLNPGGGVTQGKKSWREKNEIFDNPVSRLGPVISVTAQIFRPF